MHLGTFNANPVSAGAALACLEIVATGAPQRHADAIAARLREGMDTVLAKRGVAGYVYGDASTFHIYLEAAPGSGRPREGLRTLDAVTLKSIPGSVVSAIQNGFRVRGVELMSYTGGVTSAAHSEADADETVAAFDDLIGELAGSVLATG
jgi:glutamate-1-semialdehyde 2,1-aminomutase